MKQSLPLQFWVRYYLSRAGKPFLAMLAVCLVMCAATGYLYVQGNQYQVKAAGLLAENQRLRTQPQPVRQTLSADIGLQYILAAPLQKAQESFAREMPQYLERRGLKVLSVQSLERRNLGEEAEVATVELGIEGNASVLAHELERLFVGHEYLALSRWEIVASNRPGVQQSVIRIEQLYRTGGKP